MFSSYNPPIISSIYLQNLEISATEAEAAAKQAQAGAEAARDLALQYKNETETYYTQVQQIQTGDYVTSQSLADTLANFGFDDLAYVPSVFTPRAHTHTWSEVTEKPATFSPSAHGHAWSEITGKPAEFEPAEHAHSWLQIEGKPGTFPPEMHYHDWASIENKPNVFNPAAHNHSWGDITGKPAAFTPSAHTHNWDSIQNKPLVFAPSSHAHHWDTVTNKPEQATRWPHFSEVTNKPEQATRWPSYEEVTNKPSLGSAAQKNAGTSAGDLMEVFAFGLGAENTQSVLDAEALRGCGFYGGGSDPSVNYPTSFSRYGPFVNMRRGPNIQSSIHIYGYDGVIDAAVMATADGGQTWGKASLYHSLNTNFDEWASNTQYDNIGIGFAVDSSQLRILLPINMKTAPSGITVSSGLELQITSTTFSGTQVIPASGNILFRGDSSNKTVSLNIKGLVGLVPGDPYYVRFNADSGFIKVF